AAYRGEGGERHGGFYTKDEVREVVRYAAERFVEVIPEIEMPGHALAALAASPEFSCSGGPFEVETAWGIFDDVYCVGKDETLHFLERVVDEVCELFPATYFHIGGDECPKVRWRSCPHCQERMRAEGLSDEHSLQSWFVGRMSRYLEQRGKRLVGWDEILEGGLAPGATVMSWRGTEGGIRAAQMGHDVVMSPTSHCYLDYKQAPADEEPGAWFAPALELSTVYGYEPTPRELTPEQAHHVLGVQANVWTERMPTAQHVEYMTYPRLCALAEVAWGDAHRDEAEFLRRLEAHRRLLDHFEVAYRGSRRAAPRAPSAEEQAQYRRALAERAKGEATQAYSAAPA
ncbi:MAG TPA: family 20 glycosylhydrolase, partial [Polyangiaceae bacterium]|nr:family 20 glycosylhydrolase [Polyangiaceae bacterium]